MSHQTSAREAKTRCDHDHALLHISPETGNDEGRGKFEARIAPELCGPFTYGPCEMCLVRH